MKTLLTIAILISLPSFVSAQNDKTFQPVAVIELFTSQGCSSCPPADALLSKTIDDAQQQGTKVFALSFHVGYWNYLGWKDPFSNDDYNQRQQDYDVRLGANAYTPQMIVNGTTEFVGSNRKALEVALHNALLNKAKAAFAELKTNPINGGGVGISFSLAGNYSNCEIHFALVSIKETTAVKNGENGGRTLTHSHVVRQFVTLPAQAGGSFTFAHEPVPAKGNGMVIAYVQQKGFGSIIAAASIAF